MSEYFVLDEYILDGLNSSEFSVSTHLVKPLTSLRPKFWQGL